MTRNSLTCRFRQFPLRNLCFIVTLAVCSLVSAATDTIRLLLISYLSRIGIIEISYAGLWTSVPEHLSSHFALSSYKLFEPLAIWRLSLYDPWSRLWEVARFLVLYVLLQYPHLSEGVGYQQQPQQVQKSVEAIKQEVLPDGFQLRFAVESAPAPRRQVLFLVNNSLRLKSQNDDVCNLPPDNHELQISFLKLLKEPVKKRKIDFIQV